MDLSRIYLAVKILLFLIYYEITCGSQKGKSGQMNVSAMII